jgi:hypothetical protein
MYFDYRIIRLEDGILPRILTRIAPFITSIDSIASREIDLFKMVYKKNNESQLLLKEILEKTRFLLTDWYTRFTVYFVLIDFHRYPNGSEFESWEAKTDWRCVWLNTPRNDGKPRMLISNDSIYVPADFASFIERIKKVIFIYKN